MKKYLIIGFLSFTLMATTVYALSSNNQEKEISEQSTYKENCPYHNEDCPYHNEDCPYYNESSNSQNYHYRTDNLDCTNCGSNTTNYYNSHRTNNSNNHGHHSRNRHH